MPAAGFDSPGGHGWRPIAEKKIMGKQVIDYSDFRTADEEGWERTEIGRELGEQSFSVTFVDMAQHDIDYRDIRRRMEAKYRAGPGERDLSSRYIRDSYFNIGTVVFTLNGSPPKGRAIYQAAGQGEVWFFGVHMHPYEVWKNVELNVRMANR